MKITKKNFVDYPYYIVEREGLTLEVDVNEDDIKIFVRDSVHVMGMPVVRRKGERGYWVTSSYKDLAGPFPTRMSALVARRLMQ